MPIAFVKFNYLSVFHFYGRNYLIEQTCKPERKMYDLNPKKKSFNMLCKNEA